MYMIKESQSSIDTFLQLNSVHINHEESQTSPKILSKNNTSSRINKSSHLVSQQFVVEELEETSQM